MKHLDTLVIGGGQAGLATSYYLAQAGRLHTIKSGLLVGVGDDAANVVEHIESRPQ